MNTDAIMPPTKVVDCPGCQRPMWQEAGKVQCQDCVNRAKLAARDKLVESHLPLAKKAAQIMYDKIGHKLDFDTLLSGAYLGLIDAATRYDPDRGATFTTFARPRIDGAMRDEMRDSDQRGRFQRERGKRFEKAADAFYVREGRKPTDDELRAELGMSDEQFMHDREWATAARPIATPTFGENKRAIDAAMAPEPSRAEQDDWWQTAVRGLTREEKAIVLMHFRDGMTMDDVGKAIGISMSLVSITVTRLKARMGEFQHVRGLVALDGRMSSWAVRKPTRSVIQPKRSVAHAA